ncbi:hypothetical protein IE81DRAFT_15983 [Ceraceosorus guamensis]|uniref:Uncharacterized protein n=1 Tax=Ceraceosorus guamensis TaxID=1522189 RepID=A0A316VPZ6_9BASI|nr:hypothetical protein IE81DRAFT_15983 [Ceraceosorus guamensis]PWN39602.1 hypothetical protein IE81DRAFT_15983 [Ceraceosorus guamensis]
MSPSLEANRPVMRVLARQLACELAHFTDSDHSESRLISHIQNSVPQRRLVRLFFPEKNYKCGGGDGRHGAARLLTALVGRRRRVSHLIRKSTYTRTGSTLESLGRVNMARPRVRAANYSFRLGNLTNVPSFSPFPGGSTTPVWHSCQRGVSMMGALRPSAQDHQHDRRAVPRCAFP